MRKVSEITSPSIGMHIGWTAGSGEAESDRFYGKVTEVVVNLDAGGSEYKTDSGRSFIPGQGDKLFYYGLAPKGTRATRNPEENPQREIAYAERAAVKDEHRRLRRSNKRLLIALVITITLLAAAMGTAALKLYGVTP